MTQAYMNEITEARAEAGNSALGRLSQGETMKATHSAGCAHGYAYCIGLPQFWLDKWKMSVREPDEQNENDASYEG